MALIAVSKADDVLRACGDLSFTRELDHCATPNQNARATFVAGWEWRTNALEVFGDRLGLIPIFYSAQGSTSRSRALGSLFASTDGSTLKTGVRAMSYSGRGACNPYRKRQSPMVVTAHHTRRNDLRKGFPRFPSSRTGQ